MAKSKYKPIELSEKYVDSVVKDGTGKTVAPNVYNGIKQTALFLGAELNVTRDDLLTNLSEILTHKSLSVGEQSVKGFLLALSEAHKQQGNDVPPLSLVDTLLIPLAFETWQKDKVSLNIESDVVDYLANSTFCQVNTKNYLKDIQTLPQVFWINPVNETEDGVDGTLAMVLFKEQEDFNSMDVYVLGWTFPNSNVDTYEGHAFHFSFPSKEEYVNVGMKTEKGCDSSLLFGITALWSNGVLASEMSEKTKHTYKKPKNEVQPRGRFSEVREYDISMNVN